MDIKTETNTSEIRRLNDQLRQGKCLHGEIFITTGINALGEDFTYEVMKAVSEFDTFDHANDPHHEHDFGALEIQGHKVFSRSIITTCG